MNPEDEAVERLSGPDPFDLTRRVNDELSSCCSKGVSGQDITYLWLHVTGAGIGQGSVEGGGNLSLDDWLNIIDEAAAGGVKNMMVSVLTGLSSYGDLWDICSWAQQTHGIKVGIYTNADSITADDLDHFRGLQPSMTKVYVRRDVLDQVALLSDEGYWVEVGEVALEKNADACTLPVRMVFVNSKGVL